MFLSWVHTNISPRCTSLLRWWKAHHLNTIIGLDIDSDSIKLLKINSTKRPYMVEKFSLTPLAVGIVEKEEIKNYATVVSLLKNMLNMADIKVKQVALAISRASVVIKSMLIDSRLNSAEIESRAWLEANRLSADLVGDIYLDFVTESPSASDPTHRELTLVACRKDHIKTYLEVLQQSGLIPKIIDVNCYALARAITLLPAPLTPLKTIAVLNLNFTLSSLVVVHENQLIYAHDQSYDGRRLMLQVRKLWHEDDKALIDIFQTKVAADEEAFVALLKDNLSAHLRHTIHFFYSSRPNIAIQQLVLAGDCAIIPNLAAFIQQETNIETVLANPFSTMMIAPDVEKEKLLAYAPTLMLSAGLALSQVKNL